ncbi:MAG: ribosome assembly cofactor RimP [Treponema sp.]|nr:ribosome assembly cofactor RimP [Treponema sp.]
MFYTLPETRAKDEDANLYNLLEKLVHGLGMSLLEMSVCRRKGRGSNPGSVQVRVFIYKDGNVGIDDCSRVHGAIVPRLELDFPGKDIYLEVSSPGIDRLIRDGREFRHYTGKEVKCYRTDISGWTNGILLASDEEKIVVKSDAGEVILPYEIIAKARLGMGRLP